MIDTHTCEYAGHMWLDAGGGIDICGICHRERWTPAPPLEAGEDERHENDLERGGNPQHGPWPDDLTPRAKEAER